jgi:hypothetical protein
LILQTDDSIATTNSLLGQGERYPAGAATELENALWAQASNQPKVKGDVLFVTQMFEIVLIWMTVQLRQGCPPDSSNSLLKLSFVQWKADDDGRSTADLACNQNFSVMRQLSEPPDANLCPVVWQECSGAPLPPMPIELRAVSARHR